MPERARILLIEDQPVVREAAAKALRHEGWRVLAVEDAAQAAAPLGGDRFAAVLSDLMLPGSSGFELLRRCRSDHPETPFVMITGYATLNKTLQAFREGAFDFIPKPFDAQELTGVVDRACRFSALAGRKRSGDPTSETGREAATYHLGQHSWARLEPDGEATIGVGATFAGTVAGVDRLELPKPGEHLLQARRMARLSCGDRAIHRVWAPLSGRIVSLHEELLDDPGVFERSAPEPVWLARLAPSQAEPELALLTRKELPWSSRSSC